MGSKFECFVHISDQKYDIVVNDLGFCIKFGQIYPKIQQIVKIALNEDITFITHKFEIFEYMCQSLKGKVVTTPEQCVEHKSLIRIIDKRQQLSSCSPSTSKTTVESPAKSAQSCGQQLNNAYKESDILKEDKYIAKNVIEIKAYNSVVMAINIDWDMKSGYENWDKVCQLIKEKMSSYSYKKTYFFKNLFYKWTQYYSKHFNGLNGKLSPESQQIFDLLKVVHILYLDKLYDKNDPIFNRILQISKHFDSIDFYEKHLKDFRVEKLLTKGKESNATQISNDLDKQNVRPITNSNGTVLTNGPVLREKKLILKDKLDIEAYYAIVLAINIGWDLKNSPNNWNKVGQHMSKNGWSRYKSGAFCKTTFYKWTQFYGQVYFHINGKTDNTTQQIFDLLKIVHILDFNKLYDKNSPILRQIKRISKKQEMKSFFYKNLKILHINKMNSKEDDRRQPNPSHISRVSTPTKSSPHWKGSQNQPSNKSTNKSSESVFTTSKNSVPNIDEILTLRKQLKAKEEEINDYCRIVMAINIAWDFRKSAYVWLNVSQTIKRKEFTPVFCSNKFFFWTKFYAQNYDKLNDNLEPNTQKIFDLLKVVHTLDLHRFYSSDNETALKISEISNKSCFKSYFLKNLSAIRKIKVESKENESMVRFEFLSQRHLTAYQNLRPFLAQQTLQKNNSLHSNQTPVHKTNKCQNNKKSSAVSQSTRQSDPPPKRPLKRPHNEIRVEKSSNKKSNPNKKHKPEVICLD